MANNLKMKTYYILKILMEKSDEFHPLSVHDLISSLKEYGIEAERKSIYMDIECLQDAGIDIICDRKQSNLYYIGSRDFELAEIKLLVDTVQASKFITHKKSSELIKKLEKLVSKYEAATLQRQVTVHKRVKSMNENIYYSIDAIHEAIKNKKKVEFKYYSYDVNKNFVPRRNNSTYLVDPFALSWADGNYYLVGYNNFRNEVSNFRVDRMGHVCVSDSDAQVLPENENFDINDYTSKIIGMFGGTLERVKLKFDHSEINIVIDKFGKDISIYEKNESHFCISVDLAVTNMFFSWLIVFGVKAEIVSPPAVREQYKTYLQEVWSKY